ncbi:hypothetical protein SNE40_001515 [Patella caerulea]|uniref:Uncharacterized protein n=1 Tax=Patella caerulea TaxID=87958 RepID=A0AAN8KE50_PATCE
MSEEISAYCFYGRPKIGFTSKGKLDIYCAVPNGKMRPGDRFRAGCEECSCTRTSWSCCGIGYKTGLTVMPGCTKKKLDYCCYQFLNNTNPYIACSPVQCPPPFTRQHFTPVKNIYTNFLYN